MIIVPTYHPTSLFSSGEEGRGHARFADSVVADFKKALRLASSKPLWNDGDIEACDAAGRPIALFPLLHEVHAWLVAAVQRGEPVAIDVETTGKSPLQCDLMCVGFGTATGRVLCVPFLKQGGGRYWGAHEEAYIRDLLRWFLGSADVTKLFHNGAFDRAVLWSQGWWVGGRIEDTLLAHHCVDGELPHGLAYVASVLTDGRYWKDDVKGGEKWIYLADRVLRRYNLLDCLSTARIWDPLAARVRELGIQDLYETELKLATIFLRATIRGVAVDFYRRDSQDRDPKTGDFIGLGPRLREKQARALATLRGICANHLAQNRHPPGLAANFSPGKPEHLAYLLFDLLKFPVVLRTKTGKPATNKDAFVMLALLADTPDKKAALQALSDYRGSQKVVSTWVEGLVALQDGRVHPMWKVYGTKTGRFASEPNFQNWNKMIKRIFRAMACAQIPGLAKFVGVDLSQAELRYIGYFAKDKFLTRMYAEGINVHTVNAALLFGLKCPAPKDTNPQTEAFLQEMVPLLLGEDVSYDDFVMPLASKWKDIRTLAKNFEFGSNYGALAETLCNVLKAKRDVESGKILFPDVRLDEIEAMLLQKLKMRPEIPKWWADIVIETQKRGYFQCPISGRIQWYKDGFKRNEMLNRPIQSGIASVMNQRTIEIQDTYDRETGGAALCIQQVHDALNAEVPAEYARRAGEVMAEILNRPFDIPGIFKGAVLPADAALVGDYLDEV